MTDTTTLTHAVRVHGDGALFQAVADATEAIRTDRPVDLFVVDDQTDRVQDAARRAHQEGRDFLPVYPTLRGVRVGPYVTVGQPGCHHCVRVRERRARVTGTPQRSALWRALYEGSVTAPTPVLGPPVRTTVAALVTDELARVARGAAPRCAGAVLEVGTATLAVSRHRFIADPECPSCATLPDDGPEAGTFTLVSRPKSAPDNYRARSLPAEHERLLETMVDVETGLISSMTLHHNHPMILAAAIGGPACCTELSGYGRTFSYPASVSVAIAEALERLGGTLPRARRTRVHASFRELGPDRAVAPPALGLPDSPPHHNAVRYHPDLPVEWVYAYSFRRDGPVLVPESTAYYGSHATAFGLESSNGCALGGNLEEAVLHGIFEVAERDAFLATWFARLPVPRIDPLTSADPATRLLVRWLERTTGSRLHVFDTTMPEGIPALWLMLVDEDDRAGEPKAFCGAGAHLDPERALWSGLVELASVADATKEMVAADTTAPDLVADSDLVRSMEDHALVAAAPQSWDRFAFLYQRDEILSMETAFPPAKRYRPATDLLDDLRWVVDRYLDSGLDVVVVEQTAREQATVDLTCVKVIIPGTLPMVFGHRNRRVDLPRLRELPVRLGYRSTSLPPEEINPHPHPFP
ncbi:TOMM precursor leader peptide-binding protein [Micromonospora sp. NPDC047793]|uniref:TOMM precursor leader peptide-binding protein n=1 Tax=unclassified Micromonospora TaxID=2617518 RepID=UPI001035056D|nr:TOMM precursor leader peptide-binding protein [Verrucosispora sp. SN26_14.1]TBL35457.1 TOMM precursor leader peptide-binding protein [Verrucosispora sp. SN26_14.1]